MILRITSLSSTFTLLAFIPSAPARLAAAPPATATPGWRLRCGRIKGDADRCLDR